MLEEVHNPEILGFIILLVNVLDETLFANIVD